MKVRFLSHTEAVHELATSTYLKSHSQTEAKLKLLRYCNGYNPMKKKRYSNIILSYSSHVYAK